MEVSRSSTEYMCVNEKGGSGTVRCKQHRWSRWTSSSVWGQLCKVMEIVGVSVEKGCMLAGWSRWKKVAGVIGDRRVPAEVKGNFITQYLERPAMLYGLETVALTRKEEMELKVAVLKMLWFSLGVTRLDRIRNGYISGIAHVGRFGEKTKRGEIEWLEHVLRRDMRYTGQKMLRLEVPGKRRRERPKRKFVDVVREDMRAIGETEQDARDKVQ